jgi:hypothetical protein
MSGSTKKELVSQVARLNRKLKAAYEDYDTTFKCLEARDAIEAELREKLAKAELERSAWRQAWIAIVGPGPGDLKYADERAAAMTEAELGTDLVQDKDFRDQYRAMCWANNGLHDALRAERWCNAEAWAVLSGRDPAEYHELNGVVTEAQRVMKELDQWRRTARSAFICRDTMIKYNKTSTDERFKLIEERNKLRLELREAQGLFGGVHAPAYHDARKRAEDLLQELNKRDIKVAELETQLKSALIAERRAQDRRQDVLDTLEKAERISKTRLLGWNGEKDLHDGTKKLLAKNEGRIKNIVDDVLQRRMEAAEERATSVSRDLDLSLANNRALRTVIHDQAQRHIESYCTWRRRIREAEERAATVDRKLEQLRASVGKDLDVLKEAADKLSVRLAPVPCEHTVVLGGPGTKTCKYCGVVMQFDGRGYVPVTSQEPAGCKHPVVSTGPGATPPTCRVCGVPMKYNGLTGMHEPVAPVPKDLSLTFQSIFVIDGEQYTPLTNGMMVELGDAMISSLYAMGRIRQHDVGDFHGKVIRVVDAL